MIGPALCLLIITFLGCNSTGAIVLLIVAMLVYGCFTGGEWSTISEYAPNSAGTVFGFANILAFASGVFSPYLVGIVLDSESGGSGLEQWNLIFYITVGVYVFGAVIFIVFGTDQQQQWDKMTEVMTVTSDRSTNHHDDHIISNIYIGSKDVLDFDKLKANKTYGTNS